MTKSQKRELTMIIIGAVLLAAAVAVTHIFSRPNDKKRYTDLLYLDKNMTLGNLPEEIKAMLDESLLDT